MGQPGVLTVIPTWGSWELVETAVAGVHANLDTTVVVVDTKDGGVRTPPPPRLLARLGTIQILAGGSFGEACNHGALGHGDRHLLMLNDDVIVTKDFLAPLVQALEAEPEVGIVGPLLLYPKGTIQSAGCHYNDGNPTHHFKNRHPDNTPEALVSRDVEAVTFAAALIRAECWDELGGLDEDYPLGYEDVDFCYRAWESGWRVRYCPEGELIHREHTTQRKRLAECKPKSTEALEILRERWSTKFPKV